jgi:hypothetical protein
MRRTRALALSLAVVAGTLTGACSGDNPYEAGQAAQTAPASTTVTEENVFLPEDQDVTDCVGTVELPNCGSKEKGGWRMYLLMAVLVAGVAFIAWRVARLVRRRDAVVNAGE